MKSQAYFEKIHHQISLQLAKSSKSILLAIAWLTDDKLFSILCDKAGEGVKVEVIIANNEINLNSHINFTLLEKNGGKIHWIGKNFNYAPLMHNKFCIIDNEVLIFGSYNWTRKARTNHESITIIEGDENLILDFNQEFFKIRNIAAGKEDNIADLNTLFLRLETLVNTIQIGDDEDILYQIDKLRSLTKKAPETEVEKIEGIVRSCQEKEYGAAVKLIQEITSRYKKLIVYQDPEVPALKLEIRALELQVTSLEDEKTDIEKLISNFNGKYARELGDIIKRILFIKQEAAKRAAEIDKNNTKKQDDFREARSDYQSFDQNNQENRKAPLPASLNCEEEKSLRSIYREASKLCHPDKVAEEQKELAEKIFIELRVAYEQNDLVRIVSILKDLKKGIFKFKGENVTEKDRLQTILRDLKDIRDKLEISLSELKETPIYHKVIHIKDWTIYFEENKRKYEDILKNIEQKEGVR